MLVCVYVNTKRERKQRNMTLLEYANVKITIRKNTYTTQQVKEQDALIIKMLPLVTINHRLHFKHPYYKPLNQFREINQENYAN